MVFQGELRPWRQTQNGQEETGKTRSLKVRLAEDLRLRRSQPDPFTAERIKVNKKNGSTAAEQVYETIGPGLFMLSRLIRDSTTSLLNILSRAFYRVAASKCRSSADNG